MKLLIILVQISLFGCLSNNEITVNSNSSGKTTSQPQGEQEQEQEQVTPSSNNNTITSDSDCPSGYVFVAANNSIGTTNNFCVMKYEAKAWSDDNSNNIVESSELYSYGCLEEACTTANWRNSTILPVSHPDAIPFRNLSAIHAWQACDDLNTENIRADIDSDVNNDGTYALISNLEWITIAREVEGRPSNWTSGTVGTGCLFRGNIGTNAPCTGGNSGYAAASVGLSLELDQGSSRSDNGTASLTLSSGQEIWDLSGNIWEIVDWSIDGTYDSVAVADMAYNSSTGINNTSTMEYSSLDTLISSTDVMSPNTWSPSNLIYNSSYGFGQYRLGSKGGAPIRSGDWYNTNSGLYTLSLDQSENSTDQWIGFRCVFRP